MTTTRGTYQGMGWLAMSAFLLGGCASGMEGDSLELEEQTGALLAQNGLEFNGMKLNGMKLNGMKLNGMKLNGTVGGTSYTSATVSNVTLTGTSLSGTLPDGRTISGTGFKGVELPAIASDGSSVTVRIDDVVVSADPEILFYTVSAKPSTGSFAPACTNTAGQVVQAIPVAGTWRTDGSKDTTAGIFTFACRAIGAVAKCVEMGYKPWKQANHHQACVRMVRADYCGNGTSFTVDGNKIDVFDSLSIQKDDHLNYTSVFWYFDAEWDQNGARCFTSYGRPSAKQPNCYERLGVCNSSSTFSTGVLLKNWLGYLNL